MARHGTFRLARNHGWAAGSRLKLNFIILLSTLPLYVYVVHVLSDAVHVLCRSCSIVSQLEEADVSSPRGLDVVPHRTGAILQSCLHTASSSSPHEHIHGVLECMQQLTF